MPRIPHVALRMSGAAGVGLPHMSRKRLVVLVIALVCVAWMLIAATFPLIHASPAPNFRWVAGYSVQSNWLCYGWPDKRWRCTQHWHRDAAGHLVSDNPSFVPNGLPSGGITGSSGGGGGSSTPPPSGSGNPSGVYSSPNNRVQYCGTERVDWSNVSQWAAPRGCYGRIFYPSSALPRVPSWGYCNMVPELGHINYAGNAVLRLPKHYNAPRVGAPVWFDPYEQGASGAGHWAMLVAIGPNGWGLVQEANFYYRGGGFNRIDFRFIRLHTGHVAFLY